MKRKRQRSRLRSRLALAGSLTALAALAFWPLDLLTHHPGETVILLMVPYFAALLWFGWPRVRATPWTSYLVYAGVMIAVIAAAQAFAARMARGRVLWLEVFWAFYFVVAWRLAWAIYKRTVGRMGECLRRWGRRTRRVRPTPGAPSRKRSGLAFAARFIAPMRFALVVFGFAPLVIGSLIHRIKIGNAESLGYYDNLPLQTVQFETEDGLTLTGWFLPEPRSERTVVICHGAGANRGNFIDFLSVFHTRGYNSLIFDARGHGDSDGHTCTFGLYETRDVRAAVDWLKREQPAAAGRIVGLGSSMGAMTLLRAAVDDSRIEAVVIDSCFASAPILGHQHAERLPLLGHVLVDLTLANMSLHAGQSIWRLDGMSAIAHLSPRPVLLIHGEDDVVIPPQNMDLLYGAAGEPKSKWLGPGPHSNIMSVDFVNYQERVVTFFDQALVTR
jgi:fermentation-respiration switch protein FrsA (DUF1100 family)